MTPALNKAATVAAQRQWLRALPGWTGKSLSGIAADIGVSRSTLTEKLNDSGDESASLLRADTIDKIVARYGVPGPGLTNAGAGFMEDAAPFLPPRGDPLGEAVRALTAGRNGVDPWTLRTRALELIGFMPGDVVLVDLNATPRPGDAVCAQVFDWGKMRAETVMRVFEHAKPVNLLVARSLDPLLQKPVVVDGEHVIVKGVILPHRLRPTETTAAA